MAPIYSAVGAWGTAGLPGAAVVSLIILFILTITVLALCARCQKHSFDLQQDIPETRNSTLVRVVQLENVAVAVDNPAAANITQDEKYLSTLPEDGAVKPAGQQELRSWKTHTLDHNPERTMNGDRDDMIVQRPNTNPAVTELPVMETSLRSVDQTVSTYTENTLSTDKPFINSELPDFQTISLGDQTDETNRDLSSTPQMRYKTSQHMYETVGEVPVSADQSEMMLNPYAMYESIMTNGHQGNGSDLPAPPEELEEELGKRNISDTYARISKKIKRSSPPLEEPVENTVEDGSPPLPDRS
ncbi:uncharacterized protein si:ch73-204p21.2 isoform X2 [Colossoma macropomum]|uniref:uncharacterized protein si:ch73-204p21.2 isoform X2 n=1 Tax=Colossoma macropomum TaxID=42526 RepID=UPI00186488C0|nr:uncharacterized protein si:ch73-204p21.2 isoform X2 [Colossoma macropomum]